MDRGAWWATIHGVTKSQTWLKWLSAHTLLKWYLSTSLLERWLAPQPEVIISDFRMQNSGLCSQLWVLGANTRKLKKIPPSVLHYRATVKAHVCELSHSVVSDSLRTSGLQPAKLFCPWNSPGKNTGVGCHFLLQGHLLHPRIETTSSVSPALQADSLPAKPSRKPYNMGKH